MDLSLLERDCDRLIAQNKVFAEHVGDLQEFAKNGYAFQAVLPVDFDDLDTEFYRSADYRFQPKKTVELENKIMAIRRKQEFKKPFTKLISHYLVQRFNLTDLHVYEYEFCSGTNMANLIVICRDEETATILRLHEAEVQPLAVAEQESLDMIDENKQQLLLLMRKREKYLTEKLAELHEQINIAGLQGLELRAPPASIDELDDQESQHVKGC